MTIRIDLIVYGVGYEDYFDHGWVASAELGFQEQNSKFDGIYKLGINVNPLATFSNPATGQLYTGDYTVYGLAEKAVYHPVNSNGKLELKKGLDLLLEFVGGPGDRNALSSEVTFGARYTGLIPGRDLDKTGFGFIHSENSSASSQAYATLNGHGLGGETTLEIDYQINPAPWLSVQIDDQYIIDPGGDARRSGIDRRRSSYGYSFLIPERKCRQIVEGLSAVRIFVSGGTPLPRSDIRSVNFQDSYCRRT